VPKANGSAHGIVTANRLSPELAEIALAQGALPLENGTREINRYGYSGDGPLVAAIQVAQPNSIPTQATKTEPDKNVYLVLSGQKGSDPDYDYGQRFLFQGHEAGIKDAKGHERGYITRINLDADSFHRVTLLAAEDKYGDPLPAFDGITWNPFAQRLLLTSENGANGGVWAATADFPSTVEDLSGVMGRAGYEGVQIDGDGNVWLVEDVTGTTGTATKRALQPNGFIYRYVPKDKTNLGRGGKLQVLQVRSLANVGEAIVFHEEQAEQDVLSDDMEDLHTYGKTFATRWITLHENPRDDMVPFDANALAIAARATPFKRPENGQFRAGKNFTEFYFTETGDTDQITQASSQHGGFGAIMKLTQPNPSADIGTLMMFYLGDSAHSGFDNLAIWDEQHLVVVEDAGGKLHAQRDALDSAYLFDLSVDYSDPSAQAPKRILALGRDASATVDSYLLKAQGLQNGGDNEITGIHVSDGDATVAGLLGVKVPTPFYNGWRVFYTQQHGDNVTYEIVPARNSMR
jgi:hypothetical protein